MTVRPSRAVALLTLAIVALALVAAPAGLLLGGGDGRADVTTVRGETVELYGEGLYRHDTTFRAGANKGSDLVTVVLGVPLLLVSLRLLRRGSARGALLHAGALTWFLYLYGTMAVGAAYNGLFLVYVALLSASLAAFVLTLLSLDLRAVAAGFPATLPRRRIAAFMLASGAVTAAAWLGPLVASLVRGEPPGLLDSYATMVTDALDLGIVVPACVLAGVLLLRRNPVGYLVALPLLVLVAFLAPMIAAQTAMQLAAGVTFTAGQVVGIIGGFAAISLLGLRVAAIVLRGVATPGSSPAPPAGARAAAPARAPSAGSPRRARRRSPAARR